MSRATVVLAISAGILLGIGGFTFRYAAGASYLRTAPEACVNCHIMQPQFDAWQKASHHTVAVCVDCHLPQSFFRKYYVKAENGWRHGKLFTTQTFKEPIAIGAAGKEILQENCLRCHGTLVREIAHGDGQELRCVQCHATAGHGERLGLGGRHREEEETP